LGIADWGLKSSIVNRQSSIRRSTVFSLFCVVLLAAGCGEGVSLTDSGGSGASADATPASLKEIVEKYQGGSAKIQAPVMRLRPGSIREELSITGELAPVRSVVVKPMMDGRIAFERPIKVGDRVEAGEVIARIDDRDIRDEIAQQEQQLDIGRRAIELDKIDLEQKRKDLENNGQLLKEGFINQIEYDRSAMAVRQAELAMERSQIQLEQEQSRLKKAERQLEKVPIVAPIGGMVVLASHLTGEQASSSLMNEEIMSIQDMLVGPGTSICGIVSDEGYLAQCMVNGKDKAKIEPGQSARVSVISYRPIEVAGEVARVALLQDVKTHAYKVWIKMEEMDKSFTSGLFVRANLELARHDGAIVVARDYVKEVGNRRFVQVVSDGVVVNRDVATGLTQEDKIELVSGVEAGELLVATKETLTQGQPVEAVELAPAPEEAAPGRAIAAEAGALPVDLKAGDSRASGDSVNLNFAVDEMTTGTMAALELTLTGLENIGEIRVKQGPFGPLSEPDKILNAEGKQTVIWIRVPGVKAGSNQFTVTCQRFADGRWISGITPGVRVEAARLVLKEMMNDE
jgi:RND family efflux transporter MFP subunit